MNQKKSKATKNIPNIAIVLEMPHFYSISMMIDIRQKERNNK
jgi:hypothetical protein